MAQMDMNNLLSRPAEEFGNDDSLEAMWATKACEHAIIYFDLICSVDPKLLRLTSVDDTIYTIFRRDFPDFNIKIVSEDDMKGESGKIKWRFFCERFKDMVEDYNFGTLLRTNCDQEYTEKNSILVPRIQFLAIELSRNREGVNDDLRNKYRGQKITNI